MTIEKRIMDHMAEQAQRIVVESAEPTTSTERSPRLHRALGALGALAGMLVVLAAGVGFWALSSDAGPVTGIAAGEADDGRGDRNRDSADPADGPAADRPDIVLETVDITDANSPGGGRVLIEDGLYYVLSTAPGRVSLDEGLTEDEYIRIFRPSTFYVYEPDTGWTTAKVEDRFVSDFDVNDGVLYVVSTGTLSGAGASFGTSTDRGQSWTWQPIDVLPEVSQVSLLVGDDATVLAANRWAFPEYDEVLDLATEAGLPVAEGTIWDFDADHISYRPVDTSDPCAITLARFGPQVQDFRLWLAGASDAEKAMAQEELAAMMESIREEIAASSCSFESEAELMAALEAVSVPDPVSVRWDELGVTVPETWRPWSTVYTYDGQRFIDVGKPFDDGLDVGFLTTADDRLWVSTYDPAAKEEVELETRWSTTDGVNWDRHVIRFDEYENGYYEPYWPAPIIADQTYRVWWDESMSEWDEEPAVPEPGQETEQETEQSDPEPLLQRSIVGGGWETLTLAELAPGIDVGDRVLQDVRGTTFGVVLIYVEPFVDGPPAGGQMLVYSNNGIDWHTVQIPGNGLDIHSSDDSLLVLAHHWPYEEGDEAKTIALMMRPS